MNALSRTGLAGWLIAGAAALPGLAGAQTQPQAATYEVTSIGQSGAGNVVVREALSLVNAGGTNRLQIAGADGSVLSVPVSYTAQGEIASPSQDAAVTCYNMAMDVLARTRRPADGPPSVFVRFGTSVVRIPLDVRATQTRGNVSDIALAGRSAGVLSSGDTAVDAGILINAAIEANAGDLRAATFDEMHYAGTPAHAVARSTCELHRAEQPATARV